MKNTKLEFKGQYMYIGIDVHKKNWVITIIFLGMILETFSMNPDPSELVKHLKRKYPEAKYNTVYEAGFCGYWIDRELRKAGINNIIVNPADVPTTHKENRRKTDRIDSKKLARELSVDHLEGIYVPSLESEAIRNLSRLRGQLTKDQTRTKNRIISFLDFSGIDIPGNDESKHWSKNFINYLSKIEFKRKEKELTLKYLLESLTHYREQLAKVLIELRGTVKKDKKVQKIMGHLQSVPGIGFITAISLYTELIDMKRFGKFDKLSSYIGLVPDTDSSGDSQHVTGITIRQQSYLRSMLIEAAWIAVRKDPAMTMAFGKLSKRMDKRKAIVRMAKKLLSRIMYVWENEKDYVCSVVS